MVLLQDMPTKEGYLDKRGGCVDLVVIIFVVIVLLISVYHYGAVLFIHITFSHYVFYA